MSWWEEKFGLKKNPYENRPLTDDLLEEGAFFSSKSVKKASDLFHCESILSGSFLIFGRIGVGKTSLCNFIKFNLSNCDYVKTRYAPIIEAHAKDPDMLQLKIFGQMFRLVEGKAPESPQFDDVLDLIENSDKKIHYVLLLDELHKIKDDVILEFIRQNQALSEQFARNGNFTLILVTNESVGSSIYGISPTANVYSGFFRDGTKIDIVTITETKKILLNRWKNAEGSKKSFPFTDDAIQKMVEESEGVLREILLVSNKILEELADDVKYIDRQYVISKYSGLDKYSIINIYKKFTSHYSEIKKGFEILFSPSVNSQKKSDLSQVLTYLYQNDENITDDNLTHDIKLNYPLNEIIREIYLNNNIIERKIISKKGDFGTSQTYCYHLTKKTRNFFDLVKKDFNLIPDEYIIELFRVEEFEEKAYKRTSDPVIISFNFIIQNIEDEYNEMTRRSKDFYKKSQSKNVDSKDIIRACYESINFISLFYNVKYRQEPNLPFIDNIKNMQLEFNLNERFISEIQELERAYKNYWLLAKQINKETLKIILSSFNSIITELTQLIQNKIEQEEGSKKSKINTEKKKKEEMPKVQPIESYGAEIKKRNENDFSEKVIVVKEFLLEKFENDKIIKYGRYDLFWEKFIDDLNENQQNEYRLNFLAVIDVLYEFFTSEDHLFNRNERLLRRLQIISYLTDGYEEFVKVSLRKYNKVKVNTENNLHNVLKDFFGSKTFDKAVNDFCHYKKSDPRKGFEQKVLELLNHEISKSKSLKNLNEGQIGILLNILVRNFDSHNNKNSILLEEGSHIRIVEKMILGFVFTYEQILIKNAESSLLIKTSLGGYEVKPITENKIIFLNDPEKYNKCLYLLGTACLSYNNTFLYESHHGYLSLFECPSTANSYLLPEYDQISLTKKEDMKDPVILRIYIKTKEGNHPGGFAFGISGRQGVIFQVDKYNHLYKILEKQIENKDFILINLEDIENWRVDKGYGSISVNPLMKFDNIEEVCLFIKANNINFEEAKKHLHYNDQNKISDFLIN